MHADSLDHTVKRLTSPPMNVAQVYIPLMNVALHISRVELPKAREGLRFGRRIRSVMEISDYEDYNQISRWDPTKDFFETDVRKSVLLQRIAETGGMEVEEVQEEARKRTEFLRKMVFEEVTDQRDVANRILAYYEELKKKGPSVRRDKRMKLVKSTRTLKNGKKITIWRYPKGAIDPITGKKIGGRMARVER